MVVGDVLLGLRDGGVELGLLGRELRAARVELLLAGDELGLAGVELRLAVLELLATGVELRLAGRDLDLRGVELGLAGPRLGLPGIELNLAGAKLRAAVADLLLGGRELGPRLVELRLAVDELGLRLVELRLAVDELGLSIVELRLAVRDLGLRIRELGASIGDLCRLVVARRLGIERVQDALDAGDPVSLRDAVDDGRLLCGRDRRPVSGVEDDRAAAAGSLGKRGLEPVGDLRGRRSRDRDLAVGRATGCSEGADSDAQDHQPPEDDGSSSPGREPADSVEQLCHGSELQSRRDDRFWARRNTRWRNGAL